MKKIPLRCSKQYIEAAGFLNIEVYIVLNGGWSSFKSFICTGCSELFVANLENPLFKISVKKIVEGLQCPDCFQSLSESLKDYPETIILPNGQSYLLPEMLQVDISNSGLFDFYEIVK